MNIRTALTVAILLATSPAVAHEDRPRGTPYQHPKSNT